MLLTPYRATFLAKKEIMYWAYFGIAAWLNGFVFIDRLNPEKALSTMKKVVSILLEKKVSDLCLFMILCRCVVQLLVCVILYIVII